jgi:flagellar biosynthesis chaperone FliJ
MSEAENLEKLRGHFVSARRQEVAKVMRSKRPSVVTARRLKATQDIIDALDRAIVDENRLHPPPVEQPEIGTAWTGVARRFHR